MQLDDFIQRMDKAILATEMLEYEFSCNTITRRLGWKAENKYRWLFNSYMFPGDYIPVWFGLSGESSKAITSTRIFAMQVFKEESIENKWYEGY